MVSRVIRQDVQMREFTDALVQEAKGAKLFRKKNILRRTKHLSPFPQKLSTGTNISKHTVCQSNIVMQTTVNHDAPGSYCKTGPCWNPGPKTIFPIPYKVDFLRLWTQRTKASSLDGRSDPRLQFYIFSYDKVF